MIIWPQITIIVLWAMSLGISIVKHGEEKSSTHSMWTTAIAIAITYWIMSSGGFFAVFQ